MSGEKWHRRLLWLGIAALITVIVTFTVTPVLNYIRSEVGLLFTHSSSSSSSSSMSTPTTNDTSTTNITSGSTPTQGRLTPQEVQSWCSPIPGEAGPCDISRFEQQPLSNGVFDPKAVHMKANGAVKITIPKGYSAYIWNCTEGYNIVGPSVQPHV